MKKTNAFLAAALLAAPLTASTAAPQSGYLPIARAPDEAIYLDLGSRKAAPRYGRPGDVVWSATVLHVYRPASAIAYAVFENNIYDCTDRAAWTGYRAAYDRSGNVVSISGLEDIDYRLEAPPPRPGPALRSAVLAGSPLSSPGIRNAG